MSSKINTFLMGFTNAFRPLIYTETKKLGNISKQVNQKINANRELTIGKINEITEKKSITAEYS
ncbi:MAG: hypothetical protein HRT40_11570 [Campylobacteraceae bacterium]|nr:hypothetical protein [Campylobacteraceae bacterium]